MIRTVTACVLILSAALVAPATARADGLFFSYEGGTLPSDPGSGFNTSDACETDCSEHLEDGHFVLEWGTMGDVVQYAHVISEDPQPAPKSMWVEWRFRSNQPVPATVISCDGRLNILYRDIAETVHLFQNAALDNNGINSVLGLYPDFHTYRFESPDGVNYTLAVDGVVFKVDADDAGLLVTVVSFGGEGGCPGFRPQPVRNEWDFVRVGTLGSGEQLVSADPPAGNLTPAEANQLSSIVLTFDQPAYLYVNDITVTTTDGTPPAVRATRRLDNGAPEVLEVVLHGPLPPGETTTFTFDTGTGAQSVSYYRIQPGVPATSTWGLAAMLLGALILGTIIVRRSCVRE